MMKPAQILILSSLVVFAAIASSCKKDNPPPILAPLDYNTGSPGASDFHSENDLASDLNSKIYPHYNKVNDDRFTGKGGIRINYHVNEVSPSKGAIIISPGRNEPMLKYAEVIYDLNNQGWSTYAISHRGQGESQRMLTGKNDKGQDREEIGYVANFDDYVEDFTTFVNTVVQGRAGGQKIFILAHSMGGGIAIKYLHDNAGYTPVKAAVLSSPMLGMDSGVWPQGVAYDMTVGAANTTAGEGYVLGHGPFNASDANDVSHSDARYKMRTDIMVDHKDYRLGGVSWTWLNHAYKWTFQAEKSSFPAANKTHILLLQAATGHASDNIVTTKPEADFCGSAPGCQLDTSFPNAFHELLQETDGIRNEAMAKAVRFFQKAGESND